MKMQDITLGADSENATHEEVTFYLLLAGGCFTLTPSLTINGRDYYVSIENAS